MYGCCKDVGTDYIFLCLPPFLRIIYLYADVIREVKYADKILSSMNSALITFKINICVFFSLVHHTIWILLHYFYLDNIRFNTQNL